jgi:AcrR family transcriptional regulator
MSRPAFEDAAPARLDATSRREALLDVAQRLVAEDGPASVSMGRVAEQAEVTRALVYKHFANKDAILAALYRREAAALDRAIGRTVAAAPDGLEPKLRAFVHAVVDAVGTHARVFAPLRPFGQDATFRREQRAWDRRTVGFFTTLAVDELGLDESVARPALGILLTGITSLLAQAAAADARERSFLEDLYVDIALASLRGLAGPRPARGPS